MPPDALDITGLTVRHGAVLAVDDLFAALAVVVARRRPPTAVAG